MITQIQSLLASLLNKIRPPHSAAMAWQSVRVKWLTLLLGLTTVSVIIVAYLGVNSISRGRQSAQKASAATLRAQAEAYLVQLTASAAERNDILLERVRQDGRIASKYTADMFEHSQVFTSEAYWRAQDYMLVGPEGQYVNDEEDTSSVFVPKGVEINDELMAVLETTAHLDFVFVPVYENDPNSVAIYIIFHKWDLVRYYPNINLGAVLPAEFKATEGIFYTSGAPENNPGRQVAWTPVYDDPAGQGLLVTAVAPIYTSPGEFLGVIGIDISLGELIADIEGTSPMAGGYLFLIDDKGRAIALPERGYQDILGRSKEPDEFGTELVDVTPAFASILTEMKAGATGFQSVELGEKEMFVAYAPLASTGWSLATVAEAENMLQAVTALQQELEASARGLVFDRVLPVGGIILLAALVVGILLTNRLLAPIRKLATAAQRIGTGAWDVVLPPAGKDEIGTLSQAFGTMVVQNRELIADLEGRIAAEQMTVQKYVDYMVEVVGGDLSARLVIEAQGEEQDSPLVKLGLNLNEMTASLQDRIARERSQREIIEAQQQAIQELSTPIIPVMDTPKGGIIVVPLIGSIDTMRARDITRRLLAGISEHRAEVAILDITGVPIVDSGVAGYLNKTVQAARLKGARVVVAGISDAVAETIVDLGIDWSGIETVSDLQMGLVAALNRLGMTLTSR